MDFNSVNQLEADKTVFRWSQTFNIDDINQGLHNAKIFQSITVKEQPPQS